MTAAMTIEGTTVNIGAKHKEQTYTHDGESSSFEDQLDRICDRLQQP
jgi:hypothetical protein